jgi:hypothetical protein
MGCGTVGKHDFAKKLASLSGLPVMRPSMDLQLPFVRFDVLQPQQTTVFTAT